MPPARGQITPVPGAGPERPSRQMQSPSAPTVFGLGFEGLGRRISTHSQRRSGRSPAPVLRETEEKMQGEYATPASTGTEERRPRSRTSSRGARAKERSEERKPATWYSDRRSPSPSAQTRSVLPDYGREKSARDKNVPFPRQPDNARPRRKSKETTVHDGLVENRRQTSLNVSPSSSPDLLVASDRILTPAEQRTDSNRRGDKHDKRHDNYMSKNTATISAATMLKPKSILKSSPLKARRHDSSPEQTPAHTSMATLEPSPRTPHMRSYLRSTNIPLPSASPSPGWKTQIPSPRLRSRSSSSASKPAKSPNLLLPESPGYNPSELDSNERSPYATSYSRAVNRSSSGSNTRFSPSPTPIASYQFQQEVPARVQSFNPPPVPIHSEPCSADEKVFYRSRGKTLDQFIRRPHLSPDPEGGYTQKSALDEPPSLTFSNSDQTNFELSEQEVMVSDRASDKSHERREKELVNLVAGLNADKGLQDTSSTSAYSFVKELPYVKSGSQSTRRIGSQERVDHIERQSTSPSDSERNLYESTPRCGDRLSPRFDDRTCKVQPSEHQPARRSSSLKRHSSSPNPPKGQPMREQEKVQTLLKPVVDNINRDSLIMLNPERQREAFGIPPSVSNTRDEHDGFTSAESCTSIKKSAFEYNNGSETIQDSGFSHGAEKLFNTLGIGAQACQSARRFGSSHRSSWRSGEVQTGKHAVSRQSDLSAASSSSSIYEDDVPNRPWQKRDQDMERLQNTGEGSVKSTWKKTLSQSAYVSLLERHGEQEMRRQEIIWELCESELVFLKNLRTALGVYVHPLLSKNRTWVSGLPPHISRLFDWLDDIYQLHTQIGSALQHARSSHYPIVLRIAEVMRPFVPKFEVYQPYIVRLDEVVEEIEAMIKDPKNELGEFFRIQSVNEDHEGMVFTSFVWLPLTRLGRYLKYFNDLWEVTPKSHADYLPTFSLLHSATLVVRVMREVKLREEEYTFVKDLMSRIRGLPHSVNLVRRQRRLIAHGFLQRIHLNSKQRELLERPKSAVHESDENLAHGRRHGIERTRPSVSYRRRANSLDSCLTSELSDAASMSTFPSAGSDLSMAGADGSKRTVGNLKSVHFGDIGAQRPNGMSRTTQYDKTRTTQLYAFIFTDLVVFTAPLTDSNGSWELLGGIGVCRVLSMSDESGNFGYDHMLSLQVLPMDVEHIEAGVVSDATPTSMFVHLPQASNSEAKDKDARKRWWDAFQQCYLFTLRSLSLPSHYGRYLASGPALSPGQEASARQSVMGILASGQPLPKSPSALILNEKDETSANATEREERAWWALRFHEVLREVQRDDSFTPILQKADASSHTYRKTISGKRRFKLNGGR